MSPPHDPECKALRHAATACSPTHRLKSRMHARAWLPLRRGLPLSKEVASVRRAKRCGSRNCPTAPANPRCSNCRSEEHTSELQSLMRISYAVFCLKKKKKQYKDDKQ